MYQTNVYNTKNKKPNGEVKIGVVENCNKLNVREKPSLDSTIICEINSQTELMIDESKSTDDFYKVLTVSGLEGFCMKKFITVQL